MRTVLRVLAYLLLVFGLPTTLFGLLVLGYSSLMRLAPRPPPPSLNEGPGLAAFFGMLFLLSGVFTSALGIIVDVTLKSSQNRTAPPAASPAWKREHERL